MTKRLPFALVAFLFAVVSCNHSEEFYEEEGGDTQQSIYEVVEFTPAPGQFINEGYTATTMAEACAYAQQRLNQRYIVSLGGFGGYIVVKPQNAIPNSGGYDFGIYGNAFRGSSEPGIVWVSQDSNENGIADDEWFELYGSESNHKETIYNYAVTYSRTDDVTKIAWHDNCGGSGIMEQNTAHTQEYFPAWIGDEEYTLSGTCLPNNSEWVEQNGIGKWFLHAFEWGYVDNYNGTDIATGNNANRFRISDAHTTAGEPANLTHIDFVKVQSATNFICTEIGESSTEVSGFVSYSE